MKIQDELQTLINAVQSITENRFKYEFKEGKTYGVKGHRENLKKSLKNILAEVGEDDEKWIEELMTYFE